MDVFKTLQTLTETAAPSGHEHSIAPVIQSLWQGLVDEITFDRVGSLIAIKHGQGTAPRPRLLLAAHMDEIALMAKEIVAHNGFGFLRVTSIGGIDLRQTYGQLVTVHGQKALTGVVGCLPASMLPPSRREQVFGYDDLVVDVGLPIDEVKALVHVGDFISFQQPLRHLQGSLVAGKALDNRASVTAVTVCLDYLQKRHHDWDVIAVATVQEETRLLGAFTSAFHQYPDAAIAIDVTFGKAQNTSGTNVFDLGGGPVLDFGPNVHPGMYKALINAAKSMEMKVETGTHTRGSGTDAYGLQVARAGVPTGLVSIPLRYMHTVVETADLDDIERSGRLLGETIAQLDDQFLKKLADELMEADK